MRIHAIQTGAVAVKERQRRGAGGGTRLVRTVLGREWTGMLPIHAWVVEHPEGLLVVDTGETARTGAPDYFPWWQPFFRLGVRMAVQPEQEIGPRMRALGLDPADVRWVVITHLHTDHGGGLAHFPQAEILVSAEEHALASGLLGRVRGYLPQHWPRWFSPRLVAWEERPVGPFPRSLSLTSAGDVLLVATPGHTPGHLSVIVRDGGTSFFLAGDASYTEGLMLEEAVDGVSPDEAVARTTLARIRRYAQSTPTVYLPSHDPDAERRLAGALSVAA